MPFIDISPDCRIEVFYFNEEQCDTYNTFHMLRDNPLTPGYYYEDMIGPFETKQQAIQVAKVRLCEE